LRLSTKYNRVNISATIIVLLAASLCYYFIIRYALIHQLDNTLKVEEAEITSYVNTNHILPQPTDYRDQHTSFTITAEPPGRAFHNIRFFEARFNNYHTYRELSFPVRIGSQSYRASVTKSEEEMEDLVEMIVMITIGIIVLLLLLLFITNRLFFKKLWEPFYHTIENIKTFNFSSREPVEVRKTHIEEFDDLNMSVGAMQERIVKDYETLKNFADNASHEMQTPLAILNLKLDLLIQDPHLDESQTKQLQSMYEAIGRLTKLNQSLLLLTKIENNQFAGTAPLRLDLLLKEKLVQFEDLIIAKHIQVNTDLVEMTADMHPYLAETLLNNLLGNAIRHNIENGAIKLVSDHNKLTISNTSEVFNFDISTVFDRFKKGEYSEGLGLGLSIVKQICERYKITIECSYRKELDIFEIELSKHMR
jgi:signal transduction histidine kinase